MLIKSEDGATLGEITRAYQAGVYTIGTQYSLVVYRLDENGSCSSDYDVIFTLSDRDFSSYAIVDFMFKTLLRLREAIHADDDSIALPIKKGKSKRK